MIKEYRRKSVTILAVRWTGHNLKYIMELFGMYDEFAGPCYAFTITCTSGGALTLHTADKKVSLSIGDYLVAESGSLKVYKYDVFEKVFIEVDTRIL